MLAGLISLGACCVAFGAAGPVVLRRLMAPAAAGLLNPGRYASAVLAGSARLPVLHIAFDYLSPTELGSVAGTLVVGAWLAWAYLRTREPRVISGLRAIHTGSANDYAGYAVAGMLAVIAVLGSRLTRICGPWPADPGEAARSSREAATAGQHGPGEHGPGARPGSTVRGSTVRGSTARARAR